MNQAETAHEKRARLRAELDAIDAALKADEEAEKASAISDIRKLMHAHGIVIDDIDSKPPKRERKAAEKRRPGTYTHPDGRAHTEKPGRGRRPGWLDDEGVTVE
jgi:DNA-binding protein H-NS